MLGLSVAESWRTQLQPRVEVPEEDLVLVEEEELAAAEVDQEAVVAAGVEVEVVGRKLKKNGFLLLSLAD